MSEQDKLTQNIAALLVGLFLVGVSVFIWWAGRKTTAGHWSRIQANLVWGLFALGLVGMALGLNLASWVQSSWGQSSGVVSFQIGFLLILTAFSWYGFLDLRSPLDPANVLNDPRRGDVGRDVAFASFFIASTVGWATYGILNWTSSFKVAIGAGFAAFVVALCIAPIPLNRMVRHRSKRE